MCGISGFIHFDPARPASAAVLRQMSQTLVHRGPDGQGFHVKDNLAIAHQRLAIIDLTTGGQPMYNEDGSIVIVFNGEIYNYIELRDELKALGCQFNTCSDTEVLLRAYEQWGLDLHSKLNGVWAFAIWDERKKYLLLSRDRLGEKPLYYAVYDNTLLFGSEIKAITAYGISQQANTEVLEIYLALGYIPAPFSFYKGIYKLRPGHYILVKDGYCQEHKYWDLPAIDENKMLTNKKDIYEKFEFLLRDSVELRMRSDVAYGAFLSGGLDSSSIVALMSQVSGYPVETFTVGFEQKSFDERYLANLAARRFKTNHHQYTVKPASFAESLEKVLYNYDEPFGDSSAICVGQVSQCARQQVKMVLTGDGGDEVLSGYNCYQSEKFAAQYQKLPSALRMIPSLCLGLTSKVTSGDFSLKLARLQNVLDSSCWTFNDRILSKACWAQIGLVRELIGNLRQQIIPVEQFIAEFMRQCPYKDNFYRLMYYNLKLTLPEDMLAKVDRMSMAHSLESRAPFLDHRLVEFMVGVHKNIKMAGYERKSILRRTIGRQLPPPVLKAPKRGFVVPLREWFKKDSHTNALKSLMMSCPLDINIHLIETVMQKNAAGQADYGNFIWMLFLLGRWFEKQSQQYVKFSQTSKCVVG